MSDGGAAAVGSDVALQNAQLCNGGGLQGLRRHVGSELAVEHLLGELLELLRHIAVFSDGILKEQAVEHLQLRLAVDNLHRHILVGAFQHRLCGSMCADALVVHVVNHLFEVQLLQFALADAPLCPVAAGRQVLLPLRQESLQGRDVLVVEVAELLHLGNALQKSLALLRDGRWQSRHSRETGLAQLLFQSVELAEQTIDIAFLHI